MTDLNKIIAHLRERDYMSGVERDKARKKSTGEVFTPTPLVQEMLDKLPPEVFTNPHKTFLDPTCGDGQFLSEVVIRKVACGAEYDEALESVYGADLMMDNCIECIRRLYGAFHEPVIITLEGDRIPLNWQRDGLTAVFEVDGKICNIVCADGLVYDYSFGEGELKKVHRAKNGNVLNTSLFEGL